MSFPNDPTETADSDGDGVGDNADAFPNDPTESVDTDSDGIGNNADLNDDGDWIADEYDAFPNLIRPSRPTRDGDGVGDNSRCVPE